LRPEQVICWLNFARVVVVAAAAAAAAAVYFTLERQVMKFSLTVLNIGSIKTAKF